MCDISEQWGDIWVKACRLREWKPEALETRGLLKKLKEGQCDFGGGGWWKVNLGISWDIS